MTHQQKHNLIYLRERNYSFKTIAGILEMQEDSIRKYCKRNGIVPLPEYADVDPDIEISLCPVCKKIVIPKTRKKRIYCSDRCRFDAFAARNRKPKNNKKGLDFKPASSDHLNSPIIIAELLAERSKENSE